MLFSEYGSQLWLTDGTAAGTRELAALYTQDITALGNGKALFSASPNLDPHGLWVTDGTAGGTYALQSSGRPSQITALGNGEVLFSATDVTHGFELWVTDGTAAGTHLVTDINPGSGSSNPQSITALGIGRAVFSADDSTHGRELWVTNGTAAGTYMLKDINASGSALSSSADITALRDGRAVFSANDGTHGYQLWVTNGTAAGTYQAKDINLSGSSNPSAFTLLTEDVPCYCAGTLISTVRGDVPVEGLVIGDEVLTLAGAPRPIKWIGRRSYRRPFMGRNVTPILIRAGALGENVPLRDLYVSPDHAMYLDEVLIAAEHLVNGVSIVRCQDVDSVHYFHIELDRHDVIFAEGAAAETFVDCDNRLMFHNAAEFNELFPTDAAPGWAFCAPRIEPGPRLERIRQGIAARAGVPEPDDAEACGPLEGSLDDASHMLINGWAFDPDQPGVPVWLEVLVDDGVVSRVLANLHRPDGA